MTHNLLEAGGKVEENIGVGEVLSCTFFEEQKHHPVHSLWINLLDIFVCVDMEKGWERYCAP